MISHEHKCIFVQQLKVASTSILSAFGLEWLDRDALHMCSGTQTPEYLTSYRDYFRFSIVRNPWDRLVSAWHHCQYMGWIDKDMTFRDLLRNLPQFDRSRPEGEQHAYSHLTRLQRDTLCEGPDSPPAVDFLMQFERIQEDWDRVCDLIKKPRSTLAKCNARRVERPDYHAYYDAETMRLFLNHFSKDAETFHYEF
ncbi:MAG TPA: sulfotransferase family 2 domain-containing protein [Conexivisphaerales archaeon]|nr:sulfotransferase family 2 domain-containing protein [Conexivisphaerales archaeon]